MGPQPLLRRILGLATLCLMSTACLVDTDATPGDFGNGSGGYVPPTGPAGGSTGDQDPSGSGGESGPGPGSTSGDGPTSATQGMDPGGSTGGVDTAGSGGSTGGESGGSTGGVGPGGSTGGEDPPGGSTGGAAPGQPDSGMWAHCLSGSDCEPGFGCLTNDTATDGFCSMVCTPVGDPSVCGSGVGASEPICVPAGLDSVCALDCGGAQQCPAGMACEADSSICM
jgi:hypothetical protein